MNANTFNVSRYIHAITGVYPEYIVKRIEQLLRARYTDASILSEHHIYQVLHVNFDNTFITNTLERLRNYNQVNFGYQQQPFSQRTPQHPQFFDQQPGFTPNQPDRTVQSDITFRNKIRVYNLLANHSEHIYKIEAQISELQGKLNYHKSALATLSKQSTDYAEKVALAETIGSIDNYDLYTWLCSNMDMVEFIKTGRMDRPELLPEGKQEIEGLTLRAVYYPDTLQVNLINIFRLLDNENVTCDLLVEVEESNRIHYTSYSVLIKEDNNRPLIVIKLKGHVSLEEFDRTAKKMRSVRLNKNETIKSELIKTLFLTPSRVNYVRIFPGIKELTDPKSIEKVQEMIDKDTRVGRASKFIIPETVYTVYRIKESATGVDAMNPFEVLAMVNVKE